MKQETLVCLTTKFSNVKTRPGRNGQAMRYLEGHQVIERLNQAFDGDWSFRITDHQITETGVVVLGELTSQGLTKMAFGGSEITKARETGLPISLADDLKAAATDALKKAATLFGVGLYLYADDTDETSQPGNGNGNGHGTNGNGSNGNGTNGNGSRLSRKQLAYIFRLAREANMDRSEVEELSRGQFGKSSAFLSMQEASDFIQTLQPGA